MAAPVPVAADRIAPDFRSLPVNPNEGFPQSFLLGFAERTYRFEFYVNIAAEQIPTGAADPRRRLELTRATGPAGGLRGMLVGTITRQDSSGDVVLLRRRLLPGLQYTARELLLTVEEMSLAMGNLNGVGNFGSVLTARVALR